MKHQIVLAAVLSVAMGSAFAAPKSLENVPLKWTPTQTLAEMGPLDISGPVLTTKVHFDTFVDTRHEPGLVGENREKAANIRRVTTSTNVGEFVEQHIKDSMHAVGIQTVDGGGADVFVSGEIREFFVTETSAYRGALGLFLTVKNSQGKEVWSGVILGAADNFGRSYRADNYYETISNMVLRATYNLLANPGFHQALQKS